MVELVSFYILPKLGLYVVLFSHPSPAPAYGYAAPAYSFAWAVKDDYSKNNYGQNEAREGANTKARFGLLSIGDIFES